MCSVYKFLSFVQCRYVWVLCCFCCLLLLLSYKNKVLSTVTSANKVTQGQLSQKTMQCIIICNWKQGSTVYVCTVVDLWKGKCVLCGCYGLQWYSHCFKCIWNDIIQSLIQFSNAHFLKSHWSTAVGVQWPCMHTWHWGYVKSNAYVQLRLCQFEGTTIRFFSLTEPHVIIMDLRKNRSLWGLRIMLGKIGRFRYEKYRH